MNIDASQFAKLSLRRLWPAVSTHLFPDTNVKLILSLNDIREMMEKDPQCVYQGELIEMLESMSSVFREYQEVVSTTVTDRLKSLPYGAQKFKPEQFEIPVTRISDMAATLRQLIQKVRAMARSCFAKSGGDAQAKLVLARLNATEQDLNYLLFVEQQYIRPHLSRNADVA